MKQLALVVSILATPGVWIADALLLSVPAFRNGWWTLAFFAFPAAMIVLAMGGDQNQKLKIAACVVFVLGLGGWIGLRFTGKIGGTPAVAVGDRAPDFMLKDQNGKNVRLSDLTDQGRVVLIFFRGKYCLACRAALRGLLPRYPDFVHSKVSVVAVGPMTPEEAKGFDLPFPVLSDPELEATKKYGLLHEKGLLGKDVPRPTTLFLDKDRIIRWMRAETDTRTRPDPEEIFELLHQ
ncbi:MAG: redoxin domain-containing protein [Planctomycetes bacterium]|nr:redoxin domain-containing protein [Planctomycetota bacterium]